MIVCGGENVYPEHVEKVLKTHSLVADAVVYAVTDARFGHVLCAQVELETDATLNETDLKAWLKQKLSRAEMPHHFRFEPIKILSTGKRSLLQ